jgi:hypothetical protein
MISWCKKLCVVVLAEPIDSTAIRFVFGARFSSWRGSRFSILSR